MVCSRPERSSRRDRFPRPNRRHRKPPMSRIKRSASAPPMGNRRRPAHSATAPAAHAGSRDVRGIPATDRRAASFSPRTGQRASQQRRYAEWQKRRRVSASATRFIGNRLSAVQFLTLARKWCFRRCARAAVWAERPGTSVPSQTLAPFRSARPALWPTHSAPGRRARSGQHNWERSAH